MRFMRRNGTSLKLWNHYCVYLRATASEKIDLLEKVSVT